MLPGGGLGEGPALPFSSAVSRAMTPEQNRHFRSFASLLYDTLALYKDELAGLAARLSEVVSREFGELTGVHRD